MLVQHSFKSNHIKLRATNPCDIHQNIFRASTHSYSYNPR